jgi:benzoyl-CoA reductase subunit C
LETLLGELETENDRKFMDNIRVVLVGSFCEQPPLNLIKSVEKAGCYIVDDDFVLGNRWIQREIPTSGDPFENLSQAFLDHSVTNTAHYEPKKAKGEYLTQQVKECKADGVLFCAASFCDPALLDQPMLVNALEKANISYTALKFSENSGQFQVIREQVGTFSDSIKLWGNAA